MKIGEFARLCNTKISVLRHYDKQDLLKPEYIDKFTGYRYYSGKQLLTFRRITALKAAGFSLAEIRRVIFDVRDTTEITAMFERKKAELNETLKSIESAQNLMLGDEKYMSMIFKETKNGLKAEIYFEDADFTEACEQFKSELAAQDYQRISACRPVKDEQNRICGAECDVIRLKKELRALKEDINLPFKDDEAVVGRWEKIGEYAVKEEFSPKDASRGGAADSIYFFPGGERYWCYGWTKGKLLIDEGTSSYVNDYELKEADGELYMFVSLKSYDYRRGGKPTVLVLKKKDGKRYSAKELAKKDNIDLPFVDDRRVIGKWRAFDFIASKSDFSTEKPAVTPEYFSEIEFFDGGHCTSVYSDETISDDEQQTWTKGFVLRKYNSNACAYEIKSAGGRDYLIIEWKSGNYRFGGMPTDYYVFVRAE